MESPRNQETVLSFYPPQSLVVVGWVEMQALPQLYRIKICGPRLEVEEDYIFHKHLQKILMLTEFGKPLI